MGRITGRELFGGYCYGPVDLVGVRRGESTMWLDLIDSTGRRAEAIYTGCVYWRLDMDRKNMHFPLVQTLNAQELLGRTNSVSLRALHRNCDDVKALVEDWEKEGLHFYLHYGTEPGSEYLVVASNMEYHDMS